MTGFGRKGLHSGQLTGCPALLALSRLVTLESGGKPITNEYLKLLASVEGFRCQGLNLSDTIVTNLAPSSSMT
jgi:hypothetical protein